MKKMFLYVMLLLIMSSCEKNLFEDNGDYSNLENFVTTRSEVFYAENPSIALVGIDTLAWFQGEVNLSVPHNASIVIEEYDYSVNLTNPNGNSSRIWQVIAFEDSKDGDYDYNDLIIHTRFDANKETISLLIHPIAYGASKKINLGFIIYNHKKEKVGDGYIDNVKEKLFLNKTEDFINTYDYKYNYYNTALTYKFNSTSNGTGNYNIVWYIDVEKDRLYAVNKSIEGQMFDTDGYPFGLVITKCNNGYDDDRYSESVGYSWFKFPLEKVNINECYNFDKWKKGNWDFTLKKGAKVFDISKRLDGNRIYDSKY